MQKKKKYYQIPKSYCKLSVNSLAMITQFLPGDSWNYMPPILVPSSAKRITTQILVIAKLNGKNFFFEISFFLSFVCDIIRPYKELPVQS